MSTQKVCLSCKNYFSLLNEICFTLVNSNATSLKHDSASKEDSTECANTNVPKLLSANDLQRLAAYQPKSLEPPVLTKRGTVLQETIEKLKMRVEPKEPLLERSEFVADSEDAYYVDKVKDNDESESTTSCNSSSRTQSASSRSSSPSFELTRTMKSNRETYDSEKRGCSSLKRKYFYSCVVVVSLIYNFWLIHSLFLYEINENCKHIYSCLQFLCFNCSGVLTPIRRSFGLLENSVGYICMLQQLQQFTSHHEVRGNISCK